MNYIYKNRFINSVFFSLIIFISLLTSFGVTLIPLAQTVEAAGVSSNQNISVWWPTDGAHLANTQPFKALLNNVAVNKYQMFWQVDGGQWNSMSTNSTDALHKEATVDLSGWNWKGSGPYVINFIVQGSNGQIISQKSENIYVDHPGQAVTPPSPSTPAPVIPPTSTPVMSPAPVSTPAPAPTLITATNPFANFSLFVNPNSEATAQAVQWSSSRPQDAAQMYKIANQPTAIWLGGWNANISNDVTNFMNAAGNAVPLFVAYNIPNRDCSGYSAGGATDSQQYQQWISNIANAIGNKKAAIILEPDATSLTTCLSTTELQNRYQMLSTAVQTLKSKSNISVYIDAGHPDWISTSDMADRLKNSGIQNADGFALNTSNFYSTDSNSQYGQQLSALLNNKHFIIDTSRNGNGSNGGQWCNPSNMALGNKPTVNTGNPLIDAYVWAKVPGESDGFCNGGPSAGTWWPDFALGLAQRASY